MGQALGLDPEAATARKFALMLGSGQQCRGTAYFSRRCHACRARTDPAGSGPGCPRGLHTAEEQWRR
eukprot:7100835-Lingulodinium_polyedra.AAC.1